MPYTKVATHIELKPEHYVGGMSLTIRCKPSERWMAELLLSHLRGIDWWEIVDGAAAYERTGTPKAK